jgi:hypothetical protein
MSLIVLGTAWDTMPGMTLPVTTERFSLRQRITLMVNRYEIRTMDESGAEGALVAVAQQKRMAFKEHVTFYADEVTGHVDDDGLVPILEAVAQAARDGIPFRDGVESAATARLEL